MSTNKIKKEVKFNETLEELTNEKFLVNLINNYTDYYKKIKKKPSNFNMFDGINISDPSSTNGALEEFYGKMIEYKTFQKHHPEYIKIHYDDIIIKHDSEIYGLLENGKLICKSISLFSLLVELTNLKNEKVEKLYNIILLD